MLVGNRLLPLLALFVVLPSPAVVAQGAKVQSDRRTEVVEQDKPLLREKWFRKGRAPLSGSAAEARQKAIQQKQKKRDRLAAQRVTAQNALAAGTTLSVADRYLTVSSDIQWNSRGPQPIISDPTGQQSYGHVTGRVTALLVDQSDPTGNTVFVGAAYGGLWKSTNAAASNPDDVRWLPLIEDQPTLAIGAIAQKPDNPSVILVGTGESHSTMDSYYGLGILRSEDGGNSWELIDSGANGHPEFLGMGFTAIAFSTANPDLVIATTGNTNYDVIGMGAGSRYEGIFYSQDAGRTWLPGILRDHQGDIWDGSSATSVIYNAAAGKFFAAVRQHGFFSSSDGIHWQRLANQPGAFLSESNCPNSASLSCAIYRGVLAVRPGTNEMYAWYVDIDFNILDAVSKGIYKSTDGGASWSTVNTAGITSCGDAFGCGASQGYYNLYLAAVPNGAGTDLYAGAINIFKCSISSANPLCGTTGSWKNLTHVYGCSPTAAPAHVHPDQQAIAFSHAQPNIIYFGNDGGLYRTLTGSALSSGACTLPNPFQNLNARLGPLTQFVHFSNHPTDANILLGGTQDNGSPAIAPGHSGDNGQTWKAVNTGDGGFNAINPNSPSEWFTANFDVSIQRCSQGIACTPASFADVVTSGTVGGEHGDFYTPYILDPQNTSRILVGTCRLWRVNTGGTGATQLSYNLETAWDNSPGSAAPCAADTPVITAIAAGGPRTANGSQIIYVGTETGIFVTRSADTGPSGWRRVLNSSFRVSDIALDPYDPTGRIAYATLMGYGLKHVLRTTDAGATWHNLDGDPEFAGLPDAPVNSIVVDPDDSHIIYIGTDVGVFVTFDDGANWYEYGPPSGEGALPNSPVTTLNVFQSGNDKRLRAATYGRGLWETVLASSLEAGFAISVPETSLETVIGNDAIYQGRITAMGDFEDIVQISCAAGATIAPETCTPVQVSPGDDGGFNLSVRPASNLDYRFVLRAESSRGVVREIPLELKTYEVRLVAALPRTPVPQGSVNFEIPLSLIAEGSFDKRVYLECDWSSAPGTFCDPQPKWDLQPRAGSPVSIVLRLGDISYTSTPGERDIRVRMKFSQSGGVPEYWLKIPIDVLGVPEFSVRSKFSNWVPIGHSNSVTATVQAHNGFTDPVEMSCAVSPSGPSCSISPSQVTSFPAEVTATFNADSAPTGQYDFVITGSAPGKTRSSTTRYSIGDFKLTTPSSLVATRGNIRVFSVTFTPNPTYTGPYNLECDASAMPGGSCRILHTTITSFASVELTVPPELRSGTFPIVLRGSDATYGSPVREATVPVTIQDFEIHVSGQLEQTLLTSQDSQQFELTIVPGENFTSPVTLGCFGFQVTCTFSPSSTVTPVNGQPVTVKLIARPNSARTMEFPVTGTANGATANSAEKIRIIAQNFTVQWLTGAPVVPLGQSTQGKFRIVPENGFSGPVTLECSNRDAVAMPAGVACSFSSQPSYPGDDIFVTLSSSAQTPLNVSLNVTGIPESGPGAFPRFSQFNVRFGSFGINHFKQNTNHKLPEQALEFNVSVNRSMDAPEMPVTFSCTNLPAGGSCTFDPPASTTSTKLTFRTTPGVTPFAWHTFNVLGKYGVIERVIPTPVQIVDFSTSAPGQSTLQVGAGSSAASTSFTVVGRGGSTTYVDFFCRGPQVSGLVCNFTPSFVNVSTTTRSITASVTATPGTAGGVYDYFISTGINEARREWPLKIVVNNFDLELAQNRKSVPTGQSSTTVALRLIGPASNGTVALSCSGGAVSCSFSPASATPSPSGTPVAVTLTLGTSTLTERPVNITASGSATVTRTVTLVTGADYVLKPERPYSRTIGQGGTAEFELIVYEINEFSEPVALSCPALPAGATCRFGAPVDSIEGRRVRMWVDTSILSPAGTHPLQISGSAGNLTRIVSPAPILEIEPTPDFILQPQVSTRSIRPGQQTAFGVSVIRNGSFDSVVALSCGEMTAGLTCSVEPSSVDLSSGSTNVQVKVAAVQDSLLQNANFAVIGTEVGGEKQHEAALQVRVSDFAIEISGASSVEQTQTLTQTVTLRAMNGFGDNVSFSCGQLSTGLGPCTFSPSEISPAATETTVAVSIPTGTVAAGQHAIRVLASGGGVMREATRNVTLTPVQDFVFSATTPPPAVLAGQSTALSVALSALNEFSADVTLNCSNLPSGASCSFSPSTIAGATGAATVSIQTSQSTAAGSYAIRVTAAGGGKTHFLDVPLAVQNFSLSVSPTTRTIAPGAGTIYTVSMSPQGGFSSQVIVRCVTPPVGITCSTAAAGPGMPATIKVLSTSGTTGTKTLSFGASLNAADPAVRTQNATLILSSTAPTFTMSTTTPAKSAMRGRTATYQLTLRRTSTAFTGSVTLSCVGPMLPGVSCSFAPAVVTPSSTGTTATLTISASDATRTGPALIFVDAVHASTMRRLELTFTLLDFEMGSAPSSQVVETSVLRGGSTTFDVAVTGSLGFDKTVTLGCNGLSTGLSCAFSPAQLIPSTGGTHVALTLNVAASAAAGAHQFAIVGNVDGVTRSTSAEVVRNMTPSFAIDLAPSSQQVQPGGSGSYQLDVTSDPGFNGPIAIACEIVGGPAGIGCQPGQASVTGTSTVNIQIATTASVALGTYSVLVRAESGAVVRETGATVIVANPDFTMTSSATTRTVKRTFSTSIPVTLTATGGFASTVSFSCLNLPTGVTCSVPTPFTPSATGTSRSVTLRASSTALLGTRVIRIRATGGGRTHEIPITLTVSR